LTINELSFDEKKNKRENTLLSGLSYGDKKPNANNFIYNFREALEEISKSIQIEVAIDNRFEQKTVHLPDNVIKLGPLWVFSVCVCVCVCVCFQYENLNGQFHYAIVQQIITDVAFVARGDNFIADTNFFLRKCYIKQKIL
ncbi:hypothetical protein ALC57_11969, partial [Trachymyrmex cornetzi]